MNVSPGALVRRLLGDRGARVAGRAYRSVFVDLDGEIEAIAAEIPQHAHVLDVGGGDGEPLDRLLARRADVRVTTIDVAKEVGKWIAPRHAPRVERRPRTTLAAHLASGAPLPDVLLLADVVHHVAPAHRAAFLGPVAELFRRQPRLRLIVKDVEPGHWRSTLGYLSDRYVTADRGVAPIGRAELVDLVRGACGPLRWRETPLHDRDPPNYALVFER
ncbi:MAG TPA: class I SAM-dependent methyltransferase [Casimicrobiaceae bacterium]|nr:class I SAM-dependent methyltransferase [Casimicrobiaceae bacterium]